LISTYSIILKKVRFFGYHGLYPEEAIKGNEFEVNLTLTYRKEDTLIKYLEDTIDYVAVYNLLKKQMTIRQDLDGNIINSVL
jgi:dihydroneopterin aldolase